MTTMAVLPVPTKITVQQALRARANREFRVLAEGDAAEAVNEALSGASALASAAYGESFVAADDAATADVRVVITSDARTATGRDPRAGERAGQGENYTVSVNDGTLVVVAPSAEAVFRSLISIASAHADHEAELLSVKIDDEPRFAWRGLSLDVVRTWVSAEEVRRIIDLLALMKMNVLHLHLSDMQAWRLPLEQYPAVTGAEHYTREELVEIERYATERFVTIVPEVDLPGHVAAAVSAVPELVSGIVLHPMLAYVSWRNPAVRDFVAAALGELTSIFASPHIHIGGDEAFGMPHEEYTEFVEAYRNLVVEAGRIPVGWQESIRAEGWEETDLTQLWVGERDRFDPDKARAEWPESYHPFIAIAAPLFALAVGDPAIAAKRGVPVLVSSSDPLYLDRRPLEKSVDDAQNERLKTLGHQGYDPTESTTILEWEPTTQADIAESGITVSGIEAAVWCESVESFDDLTTLLLPRLGFVAERAWGANGSSTEAAVAAARQQAKAWASLGFTNYHRSALVFGE